MSASARDAEARKALTQPLITPQAVGDIEAQRLDVPATVIDVEAQPLIPATQPPPAPVPTPQPPATPVPATQPPPAPAPVPATQPPVTPVPATQPPVTPVPATQPPPATASGTQPQTQPAPGLQNQPQPQPAPITEQPLTAEATGGQGKIPAGQLLVNQTFRSTANLANYLPTGTMLAFQLLSPVFTNLGMCDVVFQTCTAVFLTLCTFSCIIFTFTDSFIDSQGMVRYGFATFNGFWVVDRTPPPADVAKYKIRFIDIVHALMTASIFLAVAVIDPRVLLCLFPSASSYETLLLKLVPIFVAVICSALFIIFPTDRHGIGFPIAPN